MALSFDIIETFDSNQWLTAAGPTPNVLEEIERSTMSEIRDLLQRHVRQMGLTAAVDPTVMITDEMEDEFALLAHSLWVNLFDRLEGVGLDVPDVVALVDGAIETAKRRYVDILKALIGKANPGVQTFGEFVFAPDYVPGTGTRPPAPYQVQMGDVRTIISALGGESPDPTVQLSTGITGGRLLNEVLESNGVQTDQKLWLYGETVRRPFNGHMQIDGLVFTNWDDEALEIAPQDYWLRTDRYRPGDHWGCACVVVPYIPNFGAPFTLTLQSSGYNPRQPRDDDGRWVAGPAWRKGSIIEDDPDTGIPERLLDVTAVGFKGTTGDDDDPHDAMDDIRQGFRSTPGGFVNMDHDAQRDFQWKRHDDMMEAGWGYKMDFGPGELYAGQNWVTESYVNGVANNGHRYPTRAPYAIQYDGKVVLLDGHHRVSAAWLKGERIEVDVFDPSGPITAAGCQDASCAPPPVGTGGSKRGVSHIRGEIQRERKSVLKELDAQGVGEQHPLRAHKELKITDAALASRISEMRGLAALDEISSARSAQDRAESDERLRQRALRTRQAEFGDKSSPINSSKIGMTFTGDLARATPDNTQARQEVLSRWLDAREAWTQLVRPDLTPDSPEGVQLKALIKRHLESDDPYSDTSIEVPGLRITIRGQERQTSGVTLVTVSPETELASTKIGAVVRDEISSRLEQRQDLAGETARYHEVMGRVKELASKIYDNSSPDVMISRFNGRTVVSVYANQGAKARDLSQDPHYKALQKLIDDEGITDHGLAIHLGNYRQKVHEAVVNEVLSEVRPMGGTLKDTPKHRKPKFGYSSHEQVTAASARFPTDWIAASDDYPRRLKFRQTEGRAHYRDVNRTKDGLVNSELTLDGSVSTATHELAHRMEYAVPSVRGLEEAFYLRRTQGEELKPLGRGYGRDERTREDNFHNPYVGKDYRGSAYEIMSMGYEGLYSLKTWNTMDADYQAFVLGTITNAHWSD